MARPAAEAQAIREIMHIIKMQANGMEITKPQKLHLNNAPIDIINTAQKRFNSYLNRAAKKEALKKAADVAERAAAQKVAGEAAKAALKKGAFSGALKAVGGPLAIGSEVVGILGPMIANRIARKHELKGMAGNISSSGQMLDLPNEEMMKARNAQDVGKALSRFSMLGSMMAMPNRTRAFYEAQGIDPSQVDPRYLTQYGVSSNYGRNINPFSPQAGSRAPSNVGGFSG